MQDHWGIGGVLLEIPLARCHPCRDPGTMCRGGDIPVGNLVLPEGWKNIFRVRKYSYCPKRGPWMTANISRSVVTGPTLVVQITQGKSMEIYTRI